MKKSGVSASSLTALDCEITNLTIALTALREASPKPNTLKPLDKNRVRILKARQAKTFQKALSTISRRYEIADSGKLNDIVESAIVSYDGDRFWDRELNKDTLDELDAPLRKVIDLLSVDYNYLPLSFAVRAKVGEHFFDLVEKLEVVRQAAKATHIPPNKGRPRTPGLEALVSSLVFYWANDLKRPFKQHWHTENGRPIPLTDATKFVHDIVALVDPILIKSVPTTIRRVSDARSKRAKTSRG